MGRVGASDVHFVPFTPTATPGKFNYSEKIRLKLRPSARRGVEIIFPELGTRWVSTPRAPNPEPVARGGVAWRRYRGPKPPECSGVVGVCVLGY